MPDLSALTDDELLRFPHARVEVDHLAELRRRMTAKDAEISALRKERYGLKLNAAWWKQEHYYADAQIRTLEDERESLEHRAESAEREVERLLAEIEALRKNEPADSTEGDQDALLDGEAT